MENATKALEMAGAVLIGVLILGLVVYAYNNLSGLKQTEQDVLSEQQATDFNKDYEAYNKNEVYGSELISLSNMMRNYNAKYVQLGYDRIQMEVSFNSIPNLSISVNGITASFRKNMDDCEEISSQYENLLKMITELGKTKDSATGYTMAQLSKLSTATLNSMFTSGMPGSLNDYKALNDAQKTIARKTFEIVSVEYNQNNGRINKMTYKEIE